jgi:hypothetical protein
MLAEQGNPKPVAPARPPEIISRGDLLRRVLRRPSSSILLPPDSLYAQRQQESVGAATQQALNIQLGRHVSRRDFLVGAGAAAAIGTFLLYEGGLVADSVLEAVDREGQKAWTRCNVSPAVFFDRYGEEMGRIRLATTFIPEDWDSWDGKHNIKPALQELKTIVEDLGIRNIRIGVRWENVIGKDGKFDFSSYEPFFRYCFDNKVNICLNIGLKTCGYPEIFVPDHILVNPSNPPDGATITLDSDIVPRAFDYFHQLLSYLSSHFPEEQLALIETVQPENEPFVSYGKKRWTMDQEYIKEFAKLCSSYLPKARILINDNAWNFLNRDKAPNLVAEMTQNGDDRWDYGVNYYFAVPQIEEFLRMVPFLSDNFRKKLARLDPLVLGKVFSYIPQLSFDNIRDLARRVGFPIRVSEGQAEHFNGVRLRDGKEPGDSLTGYQYLFYMVAEHVASLDQQRLIEISTWKASQLARKMRTGQLTLDDRGVIEVTQRLTGKAT